MEPIEKLRDDVAGLREQQVRTSVTCSTMSSKITRLSDELFGNGRPGLVVEMARMGQQMKMATKLAARIGGATLTVLTAILIKLIVG